MFTGDDSLVFRDIQVRTAELAGIAAYGQSTTNNLATPPTDPHKLDLLKRSINDAIAQIGLATTPDGEAIQWVWKRIPYEVVMAPAGDGPTNIDGNAGRYGLPSWVSSRPKGRVTLALESSGWSNPVRAVDHGSVQRHWDNFPTMTGPPIICGIRPRPDLKAVGERAPYEMIVAPKPDQAYTLRCELRLGQVRLDADDDRAPWFPEMDQLLIVWAASLLSPGNEGFAQSRDRLLMGCAAANREMSMTHLEDAERPGRGFQPIQVSVSGVRVI